MKTIMRWTDRLGPVAWLLGLTALTWLAMLVLGAAGWWLWGAA